MCNFTATVTLTRTTGYRGRADAHIVMQLGALPFWYTAVATTVLISKTSHHTFEDVTLNEQVTFLD